MDKPLRAVSKETLVDAALREQLGPHEISVQETEVFSQNRVNGFHDSTSAYMAAL